MAIRPKPNTADGQKKSALRMAPSPAEGNASTRDREWRVPPPEVPAHQVAGPSLAAPKEQGDTASLPARGVPTPRRMSGSPRPPSQPMCQRAGMAAAGSAGRLGPKKARYNCGELGHVSCECPPSTGQWGGGCRGGVGGGVGGVGNSGKLSDVDRISRECSESGGGGAPLRVDPDASPVDAEPHQPSELHGRGQVRKTPSWPRIWANFSLLRCVARGMHGQLA